MKGRILLVFFLFVLILPSLSQNQQWFYKSIYLDGDPATYTQVKAKPDGGYYFASKQRFKTSQKRYKSFFVTSYSPCDDLLWSKEFYVENKNLELIKIASDSDGKLLMAGKYGGPPHKEVDIFLILLDTEGKIVFSRLFNGNMSDELRNVGAFKSGDYFISGISVIDSVGKNYVCKISRNGEIVWAKHISTYPYEGNYAINSGVGDDLIILTRKKINYPYGGKETVIIKLNSDGNPLWSRMYLHSDGLKSTNDYITTASDGYLISRNYGPNYPGSSMVLKIDFNGYIQWSSEGFDGIIQYPPTEIKNGNILVATQASGKDFEEKGMRYIHMDENGKILQRFRGIRTPGYRENSMCIESISGSDLMLSWYEVDSSHTDRITYLCRTGDDLSFSGCRENEEFPNLGRDNFEIEEVVVETEDLQLFENDVTIQSKSFSYTSDIICSEDIQLSLDLGNDTSLCHGQLLRLTSPQKFHSYQWSTGETDESILINRSGTYILTAGNGCINVSDTINVTFSQPLNTYHLVEPTTATPFEPVFFSADGQDNAEVHWDFVEGTSSELYFKHTFSKNGKYPVAFTITDENGCSYTDTNWVEIAYSSWFIPNSFTPNFDGVNDEFRPIGVGIKSYDLTIYNRWGDQIYISESVPWDGKINGKLVQNEVYLYELLMRDDYGNEYSKTGSVLVLR